MIKRINNLFHCKGKFLVKITLFSINIALWGQSLTWDELEFQIKTNPESLDSIQLASQWLFDDKTEKWDSHFLQCTNYLPIESQLKLVESLLKGSLPEEKKTLLLDLEIQLLEIQGEPLKATKIIEEFAHFSNPQKEFDYQCKAYMLKLETGAILTANELEDFEHRGNGENKTAVEMIRVLNFMNQGELTEAYFHLTEHSRENAFKPEPAYFQLYIDLGQRAENNAWIQEGRVLLYKYFPNSLEFHLMNRKVSRIPKPYQFLENSRSNGTSLSGRDIAPQEQSIEYDFYFQTGFFKEEKLAEKQKLFLVSNKLETELLFDTEKDGWRVLVSPGNDPMNTQLTLESNGISFFKINK